MKHNLIYLKLIILLIAYTPLKAANSQALLQVAGGVVVTAGLGYFACKAYHNSTCYHKSIIDRSFKVYTTAQNYNALVQVLEKFFVDMNKMNGAERHNLINQPNEIVSEELCSKFNYYSTERFIYDLEATVSGLETYNKLLRRTVRKLEGRASCAKLFDKASKLSKDMNEFISSNMPKLEFLNSYLVTHKSYFRIAGTIQSLNNQHKEAVDILLNNSKKEAVELLKEKSRIMFRNDAYPYLTYVELVDRSIVSLDQTKSALEYQKLSAKKEDLKNKLIKIRDYIAGDKEYSVQKEKAAKDRERQEKIRKEQELREREVQAKERQARAAEQRSEAAQQSVAVKAAGLILKQEEIKIAGERQSTTPPTVVVINTPAVPGEA